MSELERAAKAYLEAFLDGFEFVLMAMEGRLGRRSDDREADREAVEAFLADYRRILELHRRNLDREEAAGEVDLEAFTAAKLPNDLRN